MLGWLSWYGLARRPAVREGAPSWSPDGKQIAYYAEDAGRADLFVMNADGTGGRPLTRTAEDEGAPAWSPDGRQIAYDSDYEGNFDIYVKSVENRERGRRLTTDPGRDLAPAWSPDGTRIAFMSDRAARPEFDVYLMNADGSNVERLTTQATNWFPQFSPDGGRLAFHIWRDVHVLDLASRSLRRLTADPANGMYPSWSPDGRQLAFMSSRNGPMQLFVMNADGTGQRAIVSLPSGSAIDPRWSPDGTRIVYVQVPEESTQAQQDSKQARAIYTVEVASGKVTRLSR